MGSNLIDEIDCANFFDQIGDLIKFPPDNECDNVVGLGGDLINSGDLSDDFPSMWNDGTLPNSDDIFSNNSASDLSAELSVPYDEIVQLEWLSTFAEDSFSDAGLNLKKEITSPNKKDSSFRTSSPVSVLENSSSSTNSSLIANIPLCGPQRARSKRPHPPTFNPRPGIIENFAESSNPQAIKIREVPRPEEKNKKKKKDKENETSREVSPQATIRKCMHCEITKTPQWRAGPLGPKTLCNACGVRFKSGRLFPEYRPAASPTFVPSVHSNSHKKVLEMRNKAGQGGNMVAVPVVDNKPKPDDLVSNNV